MSVKKEPEECANRCVKLEIDPSNIKHEIKHEKDDSAAKDKPQTTSETFPCTCILAPRITEDKPKPKFNFRKFNRVYVEWDPKDRYVPADSNTLVRYFSYWGVVENAWISSDHGIACVEYNNSHSVSKVQMARPHGQTRTRRCHPKYYPAVRNVLLIAEDNPGKDSPALFQYLKSFGRVVHFAMHFNRERSCHLIFATFQDYDSVDFLTLKLYLRMGSWKFYISPVKGTVYLGSDGFPESYREPDSQVLHDFAKQIPENLPLVHTDKTAASESSTDTTALASISNDTLENAPMDPTCRTSPDRSLHPAAAVSENSSVCDAALSKSTNNGNDVDEDIQILEIPQVQTELIDLTHEDDDSNADQDEIEVEWESITPWNADVMITEVISKEKTSDEDDDIIFLRKVVHCCRKCGGQIITVTLD